jgi:hypothetical protein
LGISKGVGEVHVDGYRQTDNTVSLVDDGGIHQVEVRMGLEKEHHGQRQEKDYNLICVWFSPYTPYVVYTARTL